LEGGEENEVMSISNQATNVSKPSKAEQLTSSAHQEANPTIIQEPILPNPEVRPRKPRRSYDKAYKTRILEVYEACQSGAERSALLRREGLYSSVIPAWRNEKANGKLKRPSQKNSPSIDHLKRENEQLKKKLAQAEAIIELQKKVSELLGTHILSQDANEVS
jgi:transposase-like protein